MKLIRSFLLVPSVVATPICRDVTVPVNISATNTHLPGDLSPVSLSSFLSLGFQSVVNPPIAGSHYWDGYAFDGEPYHSSNYSWTQRSLRRGYQTLAIDRLCNGESTHADPLRVFQLPANVEVTHAVVQAIKAGILGPERKIHDIVLVGHFYGSVIGQVFAAKYPQDVRTLIVTGWAAINSRKHAGVPSSNQTVAPRLPSGYIQSTNESGASINSSYGYGTPTATDHFDPMLPHVAFINEGTAIVGEDLSLVYSPQFMGDVIVITGKNDSYWCGYENQANCGTGASNAVGQGKPVFPNARSYEYYLPPSTGHEWNYHYSQDGSFGIVFAVLEKQLRR